MLSQSDGEDRLREYLTVIPTQQNLPPNDSELRWRYAVGIRYRAARRAAGLDLKELAELTGSSPGRLRALESGRSRDFLLHIRAALAISENFDSLFANHPGQRVDGMWLMTW